MEDDDRARRWELVLPHRERLVRLARGLVHDPGDAEACVQEALTRCVTFPTLDEANVAAFLVATTRRLCADHHRGHARTSRVAARLSGRAVAEPGPDEVVCDRAEAAWVSERLADLPGRQRDVVLARAAGHSPQEIAERLAVSYKTVETLLYRVRVRARAELERAYAVVALGTARWSRTDWTALGAASVAVVAAGAALMLAPPPAPATAESVPSAAVLPTPERAPAPSRTTGAGVPGSRHLPPPRPTSRPSGTGSPSLPPVSLSPCAFPPYLADPCVSPDPSKTPGAEVLDCVRYGIDREEGFRCNSSPTPSPSGSRRNAPDGGDR